MLSSQFCRWIGAQFGLLGFQTPFTLPILRILLTNATYIIIQTCQYDPYAHMCSMYGIFTYIGVIYMHMGKFQMTSKNNRNTVIEPIPKLRLDPLGMDGMMGWISNRWITPVTPNVEASFGCAGICTWCHAGPSRSSSGVGPSDYAGLIFPGLRTWRFLRS